jgi:PEP-CTERM motif-containing protein
VAYNPAIFSGLVKNAGTGTFNVVGTTATFAGGSSGNVPMAAFVNAQGAAFAKAGSGLLEVDGVPSLGNASPLAIGESGTLRFKPSSGSASIGSAVTATVSNSATLELAGSVASLSSGGNRVNILNNRTAAAGILVSGTHQIVGNIDGSGTTQVNAGSDLTANHIIQSVLIIGGTSTSHCLMTIDASDSAGNPLGQSNGLALGGSLVPSDPFGAGSIGPAGLSSGGGNELASLSPSSSVGNGNPSSVPEPSTLLLVLLAIAGLIGQRFALRLSARRNDY